MGVEMMMSLFDGNPLMHIKRGFSGNEKNSQIIAIKYDWSKVCIIQGFYMRGFILGAKQRGASSKYLQIIEEDEVCAVYSMSKWD